MTSKPCLKATLVDKLFELDTRYTKKNQIKNKTVNTILREIIDTGKANEYNLCYENAKKVRDLCDINGINYTNPKRLKPYLVNELIKKYENGTLKGYNIPKKKISKKIIKKASKKTSKKTRKKTGKKTGKKTPTGIGLYIEKKLSEYGIIPTKKIISDFQFFVNANPNIPKEIMAEIFINQFDLEEIYANQILLILKSKKKPNISPNQRFKKDLPKKKRDLVNYCIFLGNKKCDKMKITDIKTFIVENELKLLLSNIKKHVIPSTEKEIKAFNVFSQGIRNAYNSDWFHLLYVFNIKKKFPNFFKTYKHLSKLTVYCLKSLKSRLGALPDDIYKYREADDLHKYLINLWPTIDVQITYN